MEMSGQFHTSAASSPHPSPRSSRRAERTGDRAGRTVGLELNPLPCQELHPGRTARSQSLLDESSRLRTLLILYSSLT
jgi:hypothetical protein